MNENMCSARAQGPRACRLRILALALILFIGTSPVIWAATFTVTDTADTLSAGSLREAIVAANVTPGADIINLPAGTYVLAIIGIDDAAFAGDLDITDDLTISGAGAATTVIDANEIDRVFHVIGANVTFSAVTITNGMTGGEGGGVLNDGGTLTLINSIVSENTAAEDFGVHDGGGIANIGGTVKLHNSSVSDNTATDAGGGILNQTFAAVSATLTLINSTVSDNTARDDGGGIRNEQGTVELTDSTVSGNTTQDDGGGIRNNGGTVTLISSTVSGNTAADPGVLTNFGGGVFNNNGGTLTLTNSTISGNTTQDAGGGLLNDTDSTVTVSNSTITANVVTGPGPRLRGGGIRNLGTANFQNTIIAGNEADSGADCSSSASTGGTLTPLGYNLVGAATGCPGSTVGDQTVGPAEVFTTVLGPLQDNGGPTSTHALLAGSPAIDAGNPAGCTDDTGATLTTDQRGVSRPLGPACDIGAYEEFVHGSIDVRVSASSDDAEEWESGTIDLRSTDLELVFDKPETGDQTVGMRFNGVAIPPGASIVNAYIQFQVDETDSDPTSSHTIAGEATDNAATFISSDGNISSRSRTVSTVSWQPVPWTTIGEAGPDQQTPDIAAIIQEIVNRPGWLSGNSLAIIITGGTGVPIAVTAESFDGDPNGAPLLHVEYVLGANTPPIVAITAPLDGAVFTEGDSITFTGTATDNEDGDVTGALSWSSDLDGPIGTGGSFSTSTLSLGTHTITALVTDTGGLERAETITVTVNPVGLAALDVRVAAHSDDAEERATGSISIKSTDLELGFDRDEQTVGMRFNGVTIPPLATIVSAYIQFKVDETDSGAATSLTIVGEATDNAVTFVQDGGNISERGTTTSSVLWEPVAWTVRSEAGPDQQTPDIAAIIQEIVNRPGWSSGNSLVIIITSNGAGGTRTAESFNGDPNGAPLLHVEYLP